MLLTLLIVTSAACLAAGLITANTVFTYVALGIAVVAAALIAANIALHKRKMPDGATDADDEHYGGRSDEQSSANRRDPSEPASDSDDGEDSNLLVPGASEATEEAPSVPWEADPSTNVRESDANNGSAPVVGGVESDLVFVVPGRKRFHRQNCHLLRNDSQELTLEEAGEEGFTGCTACASDLTLTTSSSAAGHRS